ncbi:hypothetical protein RDI58_022503 [Solanum bulbocastanum]|uniref:Uncharacterized protein n=1 Tax=Solanum bulbocastanum TaxID=147425 RepID=A0AAN8T5V7_SOLBU
MEEGSCTKFASTDFAVPIRGVPRSSRVAISSLLPVSNAKESTLVYFLYNLWSIWSTFVFPLVSASSKSDEFVTWLRATSQNPHLEIAILILLHLLAKVTTKEKKEWQRRKSSKSAEMEEQQVDEVCSRIQNLILHSQAEEKVVVKRLCAKDVYGNPKFLWLPKKHVEENLLKPPFPKKGQVTDLLIHDPIKRRTFTVELVRDDEDEYQISGSEWDEYAAQHKFECGDFI